jgi:hypothetical protein
MRPTGGSGIEGRFRLQRLHRGLVDRRRRALRRTYAGSGSVLTRRPRIRTNGSAASLKEAKAEVLGRVEGVGKAGGGPLTSLSPLAALPNSRRFFMHLLRGVTPFRRDRYRCWSSICGRHDGLGNDFIGGRFGDASAQSQEAKRCCVLRLKS